MFEVLLCLKLIELILNFLKDFLFLTGGTQKFPGAGDFVIPKKNVNAIF